MILRWLPILLFVLASVGCASKPAAPLKSEPSELMADILVRPGGEVPSIEITFYTPISEILNDKESKGFGKKVVAVQNAQFNGSPLTEETNLSKQPIYKIGADKAAARNVISANVEGKLFESTTMLETKLMNKLTSIVLEPK